MKDRGLGATQKKLQSRLSQISTSIPSNLKNNPNAIFRFVGEYGSANINFDPNAVVQTRKDGKKDHLVTNITQLVGFLRSNLSNLLSLFAEEIAVSEFGNAAEVGADRVMTETLDKYLPDGKTKALNVRDVITTTITIENQREGKTYESKGYFGRGSGLADFTIDLSNGGNVTLTITPNTQIFNQLARVSQKDYSSLVGTKGGMVLGLNRSLGAYIGAAANGNSTLEWALTRSFQHPSSWGNASSSTWEGLAKDAFLRSFAFEAVFGSGNDYITDLLINDTFYSGPYVAQYLFDNINDRIESEPRFKGYFVGQVDDPNNPYSTLEDTIGGRWASLTRRTAIFRSHFIIEWLFDKNQLGE